jgi:hypothetical protein
MVSCGGETVPQILITRLVADHVEEGDYHVEGFAQPHLPHISRGEKHSSGNFGREILPPRPSQLQHLRTSVDTMNPYTGGA